MTEFIIPISLLFDIDISKVQIDTPDGWQSIDDVFSTGIKPTLTLTIQNKQIIVSKDHLFLNQDNEWWASDLLQVNNQICTKEGIFPIVDIKESEVQETMDITVGHKNHRYYSNGIVSHNSGKTSTAVAKIGLLSEQFSPDQILAVSFSNRSANDIRNKVKSMLGVVYPYISTVHSTSIILLKMNNINPIIMNEWQSILCIRKIMEANNLAINNKKEDTQLARNLLQQFNKIRAVLFELDITTIDIMNFVEHMLVSIPQFIRIYKLYEIHKIQKNLWDFQDLVSPRALNLIKIKPDIKVVIADECIDVKSIIDVKYNNEIYSVEIGAVEQLLIQHNLVEILSEDGWVKITQYLPKGIKDTIKLELEDGRQLICTPDHKIETSNRGWVEAQHLTEDDDIVVGLSSF